MLKVGTSYTPITHTTNNPLDVRRHLRPFFLTPDGTQPTAYKPYYDLASYLTTQAAFSFTTAPFVLLTLPSSLLVWSRVYFYTVIGAAFSMAFFASPAKAYLIHTLSARNQRSKSELRTETARLENGERGHPLQGLPSDVTAEVDEAVEEIKREVELRRRSGGMPSGNAMKAAVEEKLGKKIS